MSRYLLACTVLVVSRLRLWPIRPGLIGRSARNQPTNQAAAYALLAFGPEGKDRVWLAWDGDTLYCDRNGNGDLTDPGEKVAAKMPKPGIPQEEGSFDFELGDLTIGGRTHKNVGVSIRRLSYYQRSAVAKRPDVKASLSRRIPSPRFLLSRAEVEVPGLKGGGVGGRLSFSAGFYDLNGLLQFAAKPADAQSSTWAVPLEINFFSRVLPSLHSIAEPISFSWSARRESAPARLRCSPTWTQFPKTSSRWPKSFISPPNRGRHIQGEIRDQGAVLRGQPRRPSLGRKKGHRRYCRPDALVRSLEGGEGLTDHSRHSHPARDPESKDRTRR